jgi:hypothetical protein
MKRITTLIVFIFVFSISYGQITDSTKTANKEAIVKVEQAIDSIVNPSELDSIRIDTLKKNDLIYIKKSLLDSLLKPYYKIEIDTVNRDTISDKIIFIPRFRRRINPITKDTSYVSIPKTKGYIEVLFTHGIDTLEIISPIEVVSIKYEKPAIVPVWWKNINSIGLDINEVAFVNWNAGGSNSVSGLLKIYFSRTYEKIYTLWTSEISARYGLNEQQDKGLIKTDDEIKLSSSFGYRKDTVSNWYYTAKFNFNTQFTDGFKDPDFDTPISRLFAPAYLFIGVGSQYNLGAKNLRVYLSPITLKSTFVFDETLSNEGAFGVDKGSRSRNEFGALVQADWQVEIVKNVIVTNRISLYTDYINNFGNMDIDWVLKFQFKINNFLEANFRTHLLYDDDIKFKTGIDANGASFMYGARVQFKQQIGIGVLYKF